MASFLLFFLLCYVSHTCVSEGLSIIFIFLYHFQCFHGIFSCFLLCHYVRVLTLPVCCLRQACDLCMTNPSFISVVPLFNLSWTDVLSAGSRVAFGNNPVRSSVHLAHFPEWSRFGDLSRMSAQMSPTDLKPLPCPSCARWCVWLQLRAVNMPVIPVKTLQVPASRDASSCAFVATPVPSR